MKFTEGQEVAIESALTLVAENHPILVIDGSAGTGKSTIVKHLVSVITNEFATAAKLTGSTPKKVILAATTNKAAQSLSLATGQPVRTVHAVLGLFPNNKGQFVYGKPVGVLHNTLLIVDEYSYIDEGLLKYLLKSIDKTSHIIFLGDHCQLPPVDSPHTIPVVAREFPTVHLDEQVRQESSVLKDLAAELKEFVITGEFEGNTEPDGKSFIHYKDEDEELFIQNLIESYSKGTSRFISYKNGRVSEINDFLFTELKQRAEFQAGDYVVNNSYFKGKTGSIKTDAVVELTFARKGAYTLTFLSKESVDIPGTFVSTSTISNMFVPADHKYFQFRDDIRVPVSIRESLQSVWVDFRPQYACTAHKSQGSTYDRVFIDINDFESISDEETLARLLYVAMSRSRKELHIIGEI